jgi:Tol biopolymer transport system component/predicted Ser/Thr protein kinase
MSLVAGTRLGPYEILAPIGAGGMGEVYRARDTKLKRDVALKILPDSFAADPERMARFQREAEVLASLNHPHIAQIYGVEEHALVMELVEGETLAGPLPLDTALHYARQIAEALEAAHDKGIIHRDLKPANIKVTPQGVVKVLDFGLAAIAQGSDGDASNPANSPTLTISPTRAGMILGTAAYMSPEQARGRTVDKRADIWAFGCVLYEMLTGKQLFQGEDLTEILASVVKEEPNLDQVPAKVRRLLRKCLEKDPKKRLRDLADAWELLEDATAPIIPARSRLGLMASIAAVVFAIALAITGWALWRATRPANRSLVRLDVDLGPDVVLPADLGRGSRNIILSSDGTRIVYIAGKSLRLYTRRLDQSNTTELPGTDDAMRPFFSPDGQWIGFFTRNAGNYKLYKISVEGGAVVPLADLPPSIGGSWGADGTIIVGGVTTGLLRVPASGGAPATVLEKATPLSQYIFPQILPGGKAVLFENRTGDRNTDSVEVFSLADRQQKTLVKGGANPIYTTSGHLLYTNRKTLFAIPFDVDRLETRGTAIPILDDVTYFPQTGGVDVDVSRTGSLVYRRGGVGGGAPLQTIQWVDGAGKKEPLLAKPGAYEAIRLSSDGTRLAFVVAEVVQNRDVWVYDPQRDAMSRLTFGGGPSFSPNWSPDGQYVVFGSLKGIYWTRADGAGQPQLLTQSKNQQIPRSFTPDGKRLAYTEAEAAGTGTAAIQMWTLPLEDQGRQLKAGRPEQFLKSQFRDVEPAFSPDGRWLAYMSNESGKVEVYVRAFPPPASGHAGQWQISNRGGIYPLWSRNGRELIYEADDLLMAVSYSVKGDSFVAEKPRVWIEKFGGAANTPPNYDLSPDGKHAAVLTPVESTEAPKADHEVVLLENFFDELRRRVPVGK